MENQKQIKIGFAICGSFCTHAKVIQPIIDLIEMGVDVYPILSDNAATMDTRFGLSSEYILKLEEITGHEVQTKIVETEQIGPNKSYDALIVAPCTGNTMAKMANAITDTAVLMAIKATLRNNRPVILGIATNDALGLNLKNLGILMNTQNVYFIPFAQDDYRGKPASLVAKMELITKALEQALLGIQIQPVLYQNESKINTELGIISHL